MDFKKGLIAEIKKYPDIFNEIRAELLASKGKMEINYIKNTISDYSLENANDSELISAIVDNLNYYIQYEKEIGESDL